MRIQTSWKTERLMIEKASLEDTIELTKICDSWENKNILEGDNFPANYIETVLKYGDLPPIKNASIDDYYFMKVKNSEERIIALFDVYHGYPDNETLWISIFVVDTEVQNSNYGREIIRSISEKSKEANWKTLGVAVYLKNWKALRFWSNNGFDKIEGIFGDKEYNNDTHALIGLKKILV